MSKKINAFLAEYKTRKTVEDKEECVKKYMKNEYVPYDKKADVANAIADASYHQTELDKDGNERRVFHANSIARYMLTCMAIVDLYTDIDRPKIDGNMLDDFNALNSNGALNFIIKNIEPSELKEFKMVVQMACDDLLANEYESHAFISKQVNRFGELVGTIIEPLLQQVDMEKVEQMIKTIGNNTM